MKKASIIMVSILIFFKYISFFSIRLGSVNIPVKEIFDLVFHEGDTVNRSIIMDIRLPRVLIAIIVGANLAVSGALLQSVMQNSLADPGIIGVSSGASLAAIIVMLLKPEYTYLVPLVAFF